MLILDHDSLRLVRAASLLIQTARRYEEVERRLKGELRLMRERLPAIPARRAERAGRIVEAIEDHGERLVGGGTQRLVIHAVRVRIVEAVIAFHTLAEAINTLQIGLYVCAPLALYPGVPALLKANRRVHREGRGAIRRRRIHIVAEGVTRDTGVINLVEIVKFGSCQGLLFDGQGHLPVTRHETIFQ